MALINTRNSAHDSSVKLSPCMCSPGWRNDCNLLAHVIPSYSLDPRPFWPEGCKVSRRGGEGGETTWYTLFTHARNYSKGHVVELGPCTNMTINGSRE